MTYTPIQIANTFLAKFGSEKGGISHMKLQKLAYCVHGWWLTSHPESLLAEKPEVWKFGPVFPSLYHELKIYGTIPIPEPVKTSPFEEHAPTIPAQDADSIQLVKWVWNRYGHLSAMALSDMTHKQGTAWRKVAEAHNFRVPMGLKLKDQDVSEEFKNLKNDFEVHT